MQASTRNAHGPHSHAIAAPASSGADCSVSPSSLDNSDMKYTVFKFARLAAAHAEVSFVLLSLRSTLELAAVGAVYSTVLAHKTVVGVLCYTMIWGNGNFVHT